MKITIYHNQNTIDPAATCSNKEFAEVIESLEAEYKKELLKEFPGAEIEFVEEDNTHSFIITGLERQDDEGLEVQFILEGVFETGNFW